MTFVMVHYVAPHNRRKEPPMPVFEITYPEGALSPEARSKLMDDLTTALLRAERAPDSEFFRKVTWSYVHELPVGNVLAAGEPVEAPTFKIDVTTPEGALSDRRREELVAEATQLVRDAAGIPEEESLRVWVLMHEVAEGSWGAGGQVIRFEQLRQIAKAERDAAVATPS
jgi:phenylpyruvate tautomerase PptA (4-oxalocrotonate tautomerase family)